MDVEIRPARREEIEAVRALWGGSRSAHAVTEDTAERVGVAVAAGALLVAVVGGAVVGALVAGFDGWRGNMYRLAVADRWRRRGIARRLVDAGHERLRAVGAPRVTALVAFDDEAARGFWEAAGYAADPVMGRMVRDL
ncbi:MAG TPA: GNAT family N-acetyltransferase [Solirubrobacteraceae bacterium]|nr:GNAT family N-acetyltransferase [Solirubrobacteraceae bacterium]